MITWPVARRSMHASADIGGDVHGGAFELGRLHLAGDGAVPDQLVELGLVGFDDARHLARAALGVGRTDGFVRLLGVLRLGLIGARRAGDVVGAVVLADHAADGGDRFRVHVDAVGPHIGDETDRLAADVDAFVEPLREPHGMRRREAELAAGFLLQRRGRERRRRIAPGRLRLDRGGLEDGGLERLLERLGLGAGADVETLDLLAVGADQAGVESVAARRRQRRDQRPVFARDEFLDLELAVADQPQRHRLHAAGRAGAGKLAPQHRREREPDQIVERATGEVSIHQRAVDDARMLHGVEHRLLGDGIEHHALDGVLLERLLLLEDLKHVPGDGLALAVGVGGQDQLARRPSSPGRCR